MANIVITSTTNSVIVDFNDYAAILKTEKQSWPKRVIQNFRKLYPSGCIIVSMLQEKEWCVSWDGSPGSFQIDSIDGVTPTSNSDLFDKLTALLG